MIRRLKHLKSADGGFTLVELLVTSTIAIIVLFAVLQSADVFRGTSEASSKRTDTQEELRRTLRTLVQELRQAPAPTGAATPLANAAGATVSASDLVVFNGGGWTRYCAASEPDGRASLYASRTAAVPTGACGSEGTAILRARLRDPEQLFSYVTAADVTAHGCSVTATTACLPPADEVRGVGIRLAVAPADGATALVTTGAVSLRNRNP